MNLESYIPAGDGKIANLFLQCIQNVHSLLHFEEKTVLVSYPPYQDPMYAPFVRGGVEWLKDSWDGKIANLFLQCTVQNVHSLLHFKDKPVRNSANVMN
jgi:hypothetical protein